MLGRSSLRVFIHWSTVLIYFSDLLLTKFEYFTISVLDLFLQPREFSSVAIQHVQQGSQLVRALLIKVPV